MSKDYDYCPETLTHKHAWYQTTLSEMRDCGKTKEEEILELGHVPASHACKCGQWRMVSYPLPK